MDLDFAKLVLARIKYRDGFKVELFPTADEHMAILKLSHVGQDSTSSFITQQSKVVSCPIGKMTDSDLVHQVFSEILAWEQHEACEFFRFEGVAIFSPHANVHVLREALGKK